MPSNTHIPIWNGTSTFNPGDTPFGFYDNDPEFALDADKVALFCARRLGYPISDVELDNTHFYAAFETATTIYGNEVYAYKIRQDYLSLEGNNVDINVKLNDSLITPNLSTIIRLSTQYGSEAGTGGNITWHSGSLELHPQQQEYDFKAWAVDNNILVGDLEIKKIFYQAPPAIAKYFDPYAGTGIGMMNFVDSFGWASYSPAINFMLMPLNYDLQKIQTMEMHDMVRRSNFTFELRNNVLRIFPIPTRTGKLKFEYILKSDRLLNNIVQEPNKITDISKVNYGNPTYSKINSIGRSWIFEYTLALCKEILGYVRGKYNIIPIPNNEVTLNHSALIDAANNEKQYLVEKLRNHLEDTSREKLLERRAAESEILNKELDYIPKLIYIG